MKIIVTGSAGFVGSSLIPSLQKLGHEAIGIDLRKDSLSSFCFRRDLRDISAQELPESTLCIHLASWVGGILRNHTEHGQEVYEIDLLKKVLEWKQERKLKRLIYLSSINVFENASGYESGALKWKNQTSPYARAKSRGEEFVQNNFTDFVVVRPTNLFGKAQALLGDHQVGTSHVIPDLLRKIDQGGELEVWGDGRQVRNFLHVSDLCSFLVLILKQPVQGFFNLRSEIEVSIAELAQSLLNFRKTKRAIKFLPEFLKYEMQRVSLFDIKDSLKLGWQAKVITIEQGLQF